MTRYFDATNLGALTVAAEIGAPHFQSGGFRHHASENERRLVLRIKIALRRVRNSAPSRTPYNSSGKDASSRDL
jgi:hypothetical protein